MVYNVLKHSCKNQKIITFPQVQKLQEGIFNTSLSGTNRSRNCTWSEFKDALTLSQALKH